MGVRRLGQPVGRKLNAKVDELKRLREEIDKELLSLGKLGCFTLQSEPRAHFSFRGCSAETQSLPASRTRQSVRGLGLKPCRPRRDGSQVRPPYRRRVMSILRRQVPERLLVNPSLGTASAREVTKRDLLLDRARNLLPWEPAEHPRL